MTQYLGTLFIIAAASGTGKTSLTKALAESLSDIYISISHTTRPKRPSEQENISYFFVDKEEFDNLVAEKAFLEYASVFGHQYGTSRQWVLEQLQAGRDVILDIDWQGAQSVRESLPGMSVSIFLLPPSRAVLQQRLIQRNSDSAVVIADRLSKASGEISHYQEFDYLVINDDFKQALTDLQNIVCAQRLRCRRQAVKYKELLRELLK